MKIIRRILIFLITVIVAFFLVFFAGKSVLKMLFPTQHIETITAVSEEYNLNPYLVLSLIKAESNFVSDAESSKGAVGLMQITEPTGEWIAGKLNNEDYSFERLREPQTNIYMGCWYLAYLLKKYDGDETLALCSYNAGSGNVENWLADPLLSDDGKTLINIPFEETRKYVERIYRYKELYMHLYPDLTLQN